MRVNYKESFKPIANFQQIKAKNEKQLEIFLHINYTIRCLVHPLIFQTFDGLNS